MSVTKIAMKKVFSACALACALTAFAAPVLVYAEEQIMAPEVFMENAFGAEPASAKMLMLSPELRKRAQEILGHPYNGMRVRYWWLDGKSAWIIDEIGKERPITMGVVVKNNKIESVNILTYREERGGEVRLDSFRDQFRQSSLQENGSLDRNIDGISGATMSVHAVTNVARLALFLHEQALARSQ